MGINQNQAAGRADGGPDSGRDEFRTAYGSWIGTYDDLERLRAEWDDLAGVVSGAACLDSHLPQGSGAQLATIAVRSAGGRLVGLAPFYISHSLPDRTRRISLLAEPDGCNLKILVDPRFEDAVIQEIARVMAHHRHEWDCIDLSLPGLIPLLDYVNAMAAAEPTKNASPVELTLGSGD